MNLSKTLFTMLTLLAVWCLLGFQSAHAEVTDNFRTEYSYILLDPCHGEELLVTTELHVVMKQRENTNGTFTTDLRINAHGRAIGLTSGAEYVFNNTVRNVTTTTSSLFTETLMERIRLTNPVTNQTMTLLVELGYHIEDGHVTIDYSNQTVTCPHGGH